jgi:hypothetical protein
MEVVLFEGGSEKLIPKKTTLNAAVDGFVGSNIEDFDFAFVDNIGAVGWVDFTKEVNGPAGETETDKIFHVSMEVGTGNVGGGNIAVFKSVDQDGDEKGVARNGGGTRVFFGVFAALGATISNGAALDFTVAFLFDDTKGAEGLGFLFVGEEESVEGFEDVHILELFELLFQGIESYLSVFFDAFASGHLGEDEAEDCAAEVFEVGAEGEISVGGKGVIGGWGC